jgi:hypothetical protein
MSKSARQRGECQQFSHAAPVFPLQHYMTRWVFAGLLGTSISGAMSKSPSNALVEAAL